MSIVNPQFVLCLSRGTRRRADHDGHERKESTAASFGKRSCIRYDACSYGLLQADEVVKQNESGSPPRSMLNKTRVRGSSVRKDSPLPCHEDPNKESTINPKWPRAGEPRIHDCATARGVYHRSLPGLVSHRG